MGMAMKLALLGLGNLLFSRLSAALDGVGVPPIIKMVLFAAFAALGLVLSMWIWQESLLYMPSIPNPENPLFGSIKSLADGPAGFRSPRERGLPYMDVILIADDGIKCHGWFIPAPNDTKAHALTLLFSHENAGSIGLRLPMLYALRQHLRCNILAYDYRGYGDSEEATIGEEGLMRDAHAAYNWLVQKDRGIDPNKILLYGASLGGAVSIQLAKDLCEEGSSSSPSSNKPKPLGVVVCNTFTSIAAMMAAKYSFLDWPFVRKHMLRMHWKSIEHVAKVTVPLLLIVGLEDELVPPHHTKELHAAAVSSPLTYIREVPRGTHNDTWAKGGVDYVKWLEEFALRAEAAAVQENLDGLRETLDQADSKKDQ